MIIKNNKVVEHLYHGDNHIVQVYQGDILVHNCEEARLPYAYQEVEYVKGGNGAYVDTKIIGNTNTIVELDFLCTKLTTDNSITPFGWLNVASDKRVNSLTINLSADTKARNTRFGSSYFSSANTGKRDERYKCRLDKNGFIVNEKKYKYNASPSKFSTLGTLGIFECIGFEAGQTDGEYKIFSCVIYNEDNCIGNFVPCYRKKDKKVGMYDTITKTFYPSATSTPFTAGADVICSKLIYIENINANYIDTHRKMKPSYFTTFDFQVPRTTEPNRGVLFGTRGINTDVKEYSLDKSYAVVNWALNSGTPITIDIWASYANEGAKRRYTIVEADRYKRTLVEMKDTQIKVNGKAVKANATATDYTTTRTACVFGDPLANLSATVLDNEDLNALAKVYALSIKDKNGNVLNNFIPYSIGKNYGLLDRNSKVFYTGELVGKPFAGKHVLPKGYTQVEYIENKGNSWIATEIVLNSNSQVKVEVSLAHNKDGGTYILGGRKTWKDHDFGISLNGITDKNKRNELLNLYGSQSVATETYLEDGIKYIIYKDKNKLYTNGNLVSIAESETFSTPTTAYLFNVHITGTIGAGNKPMVGKMYSCIIYDNDVCVGNFIPCTNKEGIAGMYDLIRRKFYKSATSTNFIAGGVVE